ncbi:MAG: helix-turn-helix domain-containing protein [Defluviitaleaceae bacterium]|nr:helix-turn-helix domain-containing protein [Defluviitaleaceae bacterium]
MIYINELDENDLKIIIGKGITNLRKQKGISREKLVKDGTINQICSAKTLERIEKGKSETSICLVAKILNELDVPLKDFFESHIKK